jgi:FtsP/CotA-like multicopper oxidase with cupredoxin domain
VLSRRRFLGASAGLAALAGAPRLVWAASDDGFTVLRAMGGVAPLLGEQGDPTAIWGFEGQCPGPTLKVRQGEELKVRLVNDLLEPTSIHWHGVRLPNAMDGTALTQKPVQPGDSFDYVFAPPDAGTFWYHAHVRTAEQVARGLYGALIVEEASLPEGQEAMNDVLMVIDDWWLYDSGAINEDTFGDLVVAAHGGRMGNWMTVNGTSRPTLAAPAGERLRLRLINAANARIMTLLFKGAEAHLLAIDGQPLASPRKVAEPLVLPPGGRADIGLRRGLEQVIVAIDIDGEPLELAFIDRTVESEPAPEVEPEVEPEAEGEGEAAGESAEDDKGEGQIEAPAETPAETPIEAHIEPDTGDFAPLPANPLPETLDVSTALAVNLVMEGGANGGMKGAVVGGRHLSLRELVEHGMTWAMNGIAGLAEEPLVTVERGRTVALTVDNKTAWAHALHLHGHHVRVVEEDGRETADPVWRDTVLIEPQAAVTLAFLADNPGKWMLQCHVLEHGEAGMMTWLEVT